MKLPPVVSQQEWERAHAELIAKEKTATRARDALAAERRRMPMVAIDKPYDFQGPNGNATLLELFDANPQLLLYHFMFAPGVEGWPDAGCPGCSMVLDQLGQQAHFRARNTTFVAVSVAPLDKIQAYRKRMGWDVPWYSSAGNDFNVDFGLSTPQGETFGLSAFLRDGDTVYRQYFTNSRGVEALGSVWSYLDLTPLGRQETWEDSPEGYPQDPPYQWWRRHDQY